MSLDTRNKIVKADKTKLSNSRMTKLQEIIRLRRQKIKEEQYLPNKLAKFVQKTTETGKGLDSSINFPSASKLPAPKGRQSIDQSQSVENKEKFYKLLKYLKCQKSKQKPVAEKSHMLDKLHTLEDVRERLTHSVMFK